MSESADPTRQDHERLELLRAFVERIGFRVLELRVTEEHRSGGDLPKIALELEQRSRTGLAEASLRAVEVAGNDADS